MAQADILYRNNEASLTGIYVKNNQGQMIPVNQLITLRKVYGPETVSHNNLYNSATINGVPKPGYSTGDAIKAIDETAAKVLPRGWGYEYTGITREEKAAGSQIIFIFVLSLVFIYFLLAAQYESYILPFAVVLSIPAGVFGVFVFLQIFGIDNNIYVQVSLIMLVGLLCKNAILITEYAVQRRHARYELCGSSDGSGPAPASPDPDDLFRLYRGADAADACQRRRGARQPEHWYRRGRWDADRGDPGCLYRTGAVYHLPVFCRKG
jgi:HAE1 family hydrophobic/amphiphilic exporter-1